MKDGTAPSLFVAGLRVEREGDPRIFEDLPAQAKVLAVAPFPFVIMAYTPMAIRSVAMLGVMASRLGSPPRDRAGPAVPDERIDANVHPDHQEPHCYLDPGREPLRVEDRQNVVLDESARIADLPGLEPQRLLPGGQGADPAGELDEGTPRRRRNMYPPEEGSPEDEEAPRHHEDDEGEVDEDETVSKQSVDHGG
jgi:hypothetical protein